MVHLKTTSAPGVMEALDIIEHISSGLGTGVIDVTMDAFTFEHPPKAPMEALSAQLPTPTGEHVGIEAQVSDCLADRQAARKRQSGRFMLELRRILPALCYDTPQGSS